jgi:hypothetical protein
VHRYPAMRLLGVSYIASSQRSEPNGRRDRPCDDRRVSVWDAIAQRAGLPSAIEGLYRTFAPYGVAEDFGPCPTCPGADEKAEVTPQLRAWPLQDLDPVAVALFAEDATYTWGTVDDFRHFLPRILEIQALDEGGGIVDHDAFEPWSLYAKLANARWDAWPDSERSALVGFFNAFWTATLGSFDGPTTAAGLLEGFAEAGMDLDPFLAVWGDRIAEESAAIQLARMLDERWRRLSAGRTLGWDGMSDLSEASDHVVRWLASPQLVEGVEQVFHRDDGAHVDLLGNAADRLRWLAAAGR